MKIEDWTCGSTNTAMNVFLNKKYDLLTCRLHDQESNNEEIHFLQLYLIFILINFVIRRGETSRRLFC